MVFSFPKNPVWAASADCIFSVRSFLLPERVDSMVVKGGFGSWLPSLGEVWASVT